MKMLIKAYVLEHKNEIIEEIKAGKTFIYPTDTIYGIGCNALNKDSVLKVRMLKKRSEKPFSIIAPSKEWIKENCELGRKAEQWIGNLPGPYTFIFKLKNRGAVAKETNNGADTLGIRIPQNWFSEFIKSAEVPFITTSVNLEGEPHMTDFYNLNEFIKEGVDYFIYEGAKTGKPSKIIDLSNENEEVVRY